MDITLVNAIFSYPINEEVLKDLLYYKNIIVYDPYGTENGFSLFVGKKLLDLGFKGIYKSISLPNVYIKKGTIEQQEIRYNVDLDSLYKIIEELK